ncbi:MAG: putative metallopeptidase [Planctomycetales bacterium]
MSDLCADVVARLPEMSHVNMAQTTVTFAQARSNVLHGMQAKLTPMRFENGSLYRERNGRTWTIQRLRGTGGQEQLYILTFYLPRFLQHSFQEKLTTIFHELWHIHPEFNGDFRRFTGRCVMHSRSQKEFDALAEQLSQKWLGLHPPKSLYEFLECDFSELHRRHGSIHGLKIAIPKLIPVPAVPRQET